MNKFEMTDRGKIIIAIVLLVVLLVIPTVIILISINSCADSDPPAESSSSSQTEEPPASEMPPAISNTPLPTNGSGFTPSVRETPQVQETPESTPSPSPVPPSPTPIGGNGNIGSVAGVESTPQPGPIGLDLHEGTMIFIFIPDAQNALDDETVDMLKEFLKSPKNTSDMLISVEMPRISSTDESKLISAVLQAFAKYNITESNLLFVKNNTNVTEHYIEVALSFTPASGKK